ncbi:MAG: RagB/SusD family nutrient uptake outer membrane protein [bacterium]
MNILRQYRLRCATAFLGLALALTYSCKDFLDTPAQGVLDETALLTKDGVEGTLIAAYRVLDCSGSTRSNWGCAASNWVWGSVTSDDAYKGSEATDQPAATEVELYNWSSGQAQDYLNTKWQIVYEGVVRSNAALRLLSRVRQEKPAEVSAADANGIKGEALFLRAHYHFEAWRMWKNIPYYREDDTDYRKSNANGDSIALASILEDLDSAIAVLPPAPRNGQVGRASSWTAKAYKGRVQVYAGRLAAALTTLREVQASGVYALETSFDHVWTGFPQFANGNETIFAYEASANDGEPIGANSNWGERLNFPHGGSPFGCCGFHQPSQNLVNFFVVDANGLPKAFSNPAGWNTRNTNYAASVADTVDPRLDWSVGRDGVPYKDWGLHQPTWIRAPGYGGPYSPKKNVHEKASGAESKVGWVPTQTNSVHIHLYRYADLLLLLAEAEVEAGTIANAQVIVNQIRARAAAGAQGCGAGSTNSALVVAYPGCAGDDRLAVPINDSTIAWATYRVGQYTTPWPDQATARTAVRYERRLELAMEGQRFFDLRRYGTAEQVINAYLTVEVTRRSYKTAQVPYAAKNDRFPIPQIQIDLSRVGGQDRLVQNPLW